MKKPFSERALLPIYNSIANFLDRFTPKNIAENYQEVLLQAGLAERFTPVRILINQILFGLTVLLLMVLVFQFSGMPINWLILILVTAIALILPLSYFRGKAQTRQKLIKNSLPDILDMLYISVEAGLSFDAAMKKTASKMKGPLSQEITRAMDDITKGREREEALRSIGIRTQVEDVSSFITAVIQSELLGANIANMLRIQSRVMREKRRQRAEEAAAKMPLKMLFPMIFLLFPALFIVILGPALISIFNTFLGM
ncbi:type II secretion system F family protein [Clostridiaceae bacterium HFYG-1003]|nr:type II secretion system F family protein [Clostridiaceae bacterium HFYG-1003]